MEVVDSNYIQSCPMQKMKNLHKQVFHFPSCTQIYHAKNQALREKVRDRLVETKFIKAPDQFFKLSKQIIIP